MAVSAYKYNHGGMSLDAISMLRIQGVDEQSIASHVRPLDALPTAGMGPLFSWWLLDIAMAHHHQPSGGCLSHLTGVRCRSTALVTTDTSSSHDHKLSTRMSDCTRAVAGARRTLLYQQCCCVWVSETRATPRPRNFHHFTVVAVGSLRSGNSTQIVLGRSDRG